jgi:hypothetical protein
MTASRSWIFEGVDPDLSGLQLLPASWVDGWQS